MGVAVGTTAAGLVALGAWALWSSPSAGRADPGDQRQVALGEIVYRQHCASCHGAKLEGQADWRARKADGRLPAPPHDETGHTWHHPDEHLVEIIRQGMSPFAPAGYQSDMPGFERSLTNEEIWAVLAFIKSNWPARARERQRQIDEASRR